MQLYSYTLATTKNTPRTMTTSTAWSNKYLWKCISDTNRGVGQQTKYKEKQLPGLHQHSVFYLNEPEEVLYENLMTSFKTP